MSDFLDRMALRSQGASPILRPRLLSLFEGGPEMFEEVHLERDAMPAPRPVSPSRTARRAADPPPPRRAAEAWLEPVEERWPEAAAPSHARPPASNPRRIDPAEAIENPRPPNPAAAAAPLPGVAPAPGPDRAPAGPMPAAIVRRRAAEASVAASSEWGRSEPSADSLPPPAGRDRDPERSAPAPANLAEPSRPEEEARRGDSRVARPPPTAAASVPAAPAGRAASPEPAPASPPARPSEAALPAVPTRPGAAVEAVSRAAAPAGLGIDPFAPRSEAAPAPVEIRIGRIDIHAAPPAAPAAPAEAPGPSLDAFLARPRR